MRGQEISGRYLVQDELGSGGMGDVYLGLDRQTQQLVAIKHLKPEMAQPDLIERFQREGEALRELNHPNIVKLLNTVEDQGTHYLVMEYVSGGDLKELIEEQGKLDVMQCVDMAIDLADALTRAHRLNIIHRDLKPANVLIGADGVLRLTDFGVAHIGSQQRLTATDAIVGTIDYLPPEAFDGSTFNAQGDIWSFGVMLFEMLVGERPFKGETVAQTISAILTDPITDLEAKCPDAPLALVDLIYRMLMRDPQARIPSVRIIGAELEAILSGAEIDTSNIKAPDALFAGRFERPSSTATTTHHNLPSQTTSFIGREAELVELSRLLKNPDIRLVTILAPGGMGKTRLSIKAAEQNLNEFSDGVYFVDLAKLSQASQIVDAIAESVGMQFAQGPVPPEAQLQHFLQTRNLLLIMDNFEHVIDGAFLVSEILQSAPQIQVLATSRIKLDLFGETVLILSGMDFPDWETPEDAMQYTAVKLFMQSAKRARPGFELVAAEIPYIARICRLVQGLPLGILLAAAWLNTLSPQEVADEISASADVLETEMRDVPERQRSMRAVYEYSLRLLPEQYQTIFYMLSVFRNGFDREAASQVAGASIRALTTLLNHSLIQRDPATGRYRIHELLRQYAAESLRQSGKETETQRNHAYYYINQLPGGEEHFPASTIPAFMEFGIVEWDNLRTAWTWLVDHKEMDRLEKALFPIHGYSMMSTRFVARNELFNYAEDKLGVPIQQAEHMFQRYIYVMNVVDMTNAPEAYRRLTETLPILEALGDDHMVIWMNFPLALIEALYFGNMDSAIHRIQNGLKFYESGEIPSMKVPPHGDMLQWSAFIYALKCDFDNCLQYNQQAIDLALTHDIYHHVDAHLNSLYLNFAQAYITGDFDEVSDRIPVIEELLERYNDKQRRMLLLPYEGQYHLIKEQIEDADAIARHAYEASRVSSYDDGLRRSLTLQAEIALYQRDYTTARQCVTEAQEIMMGLAEFTESTWVQTLLHLIDEDYQSAAQELVLHLNGNSQRFMFPCLTAPARYTGKFGEAAYFGRAILHIVAVIQAGLGHHEQAAELMGKISVRPYPNQHWAEELPVFTNLPQQLQSVLGHETYLEAFERGRSLNLLEIMPPILKSYAE